jgi:hypothetical protein
VSVPKFAEGKSMFVFGEINKNQFNHTACDSKERSQPVPYMGFSKLKKIQEHRTAFPTSN